MHFNFSFVVPKDIDYDFGAGKLSLYATNFTTDATGQDKRFIIGGIDPNGINDDKGPDIQLFMNDYSFVNGGLTDEKPLLIAKLFDENNETAVNSVVEVAVVPTKYSDCAPIIERTLSKNRNRKTYQKRPKRH